MIIVGVLYILISFIFLAFYNQSKWCTYVHLFFV
jgi:hypothetical protein